jgi:hypothetical protein
LAIAITREYRGLSVATTVVAAPREILSIWVLGCPHDVSTRAQQAAVIRRRALLKLFT